MQMKTIGTIAYCAVLGTVGLIVAASIYAGAKMENEASDKALDAEGELDKAKENLAKAKEVVDAAMAKAKEAAMAAAATYK